MFAGEDPERDIWDLLLAVPPSGGRRVTVYGAERLKHLENVPVLVGDEGLDTAFAVFVSSAGDFERDEDKKLAPHLAALQSSRSGQLVRCCAPTSAADRVALVASWWPGATTVFAHDVLSRCVTLERAWQACDQARRAGLEPTPAMAAAVCPEEPGWNLADHLMSGDKRRAMAVARRLPRGELAALIGLLASRLSVAEQIAEGVRTGLSPREAAARLPERYVANKVAPYAAAYGTDRTRRCRRILAAMEAAWRAGAPAGLAESLVALW